MSESTGLSDVGARFALAWLDGREDAASVVEEAALVELGAGHRDDAAALLWLLRRYDQERAEALAQQNDIPLQGTDETEGRQP